MAFFWEQRKLSEVSSIVSGGTPDTKKEEYWDGNIDWYVPAEISEQIYVNDSERKISELGLKNSSAKLLPANKTILFTSRAGIGKMAILAHDACTNQGFQSLVLNDNNVPYFVYSMGNQIKLKANKLASGSTFAEISGRVLGNIELFFPDKNEQMKIGSLFSKLDNLITLHQRKCENLKKLKKFMLQKLFPQNGENVPKVRFLNFTDTWEQRKVSELSEKTFGGGTPKTSNDSFWKGNIPWIQSSDLVEGSLFDVEPRKYISQEAVEKSATKLVPEKSVAIVTRVGVGKLAFMPFSYATSQDFLSLSVLKTEPQFTVYALYKKLQSELNAVQGTSIKGVTKDELLAKEVMIPCYKEQEKIGSYLHSLDHLITLHQRKCDKLKEVKKYMLQNMFV